MGKDQDLLEAARKGDTATIEKILCQKSKKTAIALAQVAFPSLRRGANPICQDVNGCTPLHYAALHGHRGAVSMLLKYEASSNISDLNGGTPLHMAAWNGHDDICEILLTQGPSLATVNTQNHEGETALHCASQYGHAQVVTVLLKHQADPTFINAKDETALDLAAQYGRLDTVHQLLKGHPELLQGQSGTEPRKHSALHLASRNGHTQVVSTLLEAGFDINTQTSSGTSLHEAALFGKQDVVRLLLAAGIEVKLTDNNRRTAIDLLGDLQGRMSMDVAKLIGDYMLTPGEMKKHSSASPKRASSKEAESEDQPLYDSVAITRPKPSPRRMSGSPKLDAASSPHKSSPKNRRVERDKANKSPSRLVNRTPPPVPPHAVVYDDDGAIYDVPTVNKPVPQPYSKNGSPKSGATSRSVAVRTPSPSSVNTSSPDTPKKPPRKKYSSPGILNKNNNNPSSSPNSTDTSLVSDGKSSPITDKLNKETDSSLVNSKNSSPIIGRVDKTTDQSLATEKTSSSPLAKVKNKHSDSVLYNDDGIYELLSTAMSGSRGNLTEDGNVKADGKSAVKDAQKIEKSKESDQKSVSSHMTETTKTSSSKDNNTSNKISQDTTNISEKSRPERPASQERPPSLEFDSKRSSRETPLSPTGYEQPPTPDHPPPSPLTAVQGIQEKINPKEKRKSRDIETITELEFLAPESQTKVATSDEQTETDSPPGGNTEQTAESCIQSNHDNQNGIAGEEQCNKCPEGGATNKDAISTTSCVEEVRITGSNPFLEECRQCLIKGSKPRGVRRVKSQIYDNIIITSQRQKHRKRRTSAPGHYQFEPVPEKGENSNGSPPSQTEALMQTSNTSDDKGFKSEEEINADFDMFMEGIEKKVQEKSHFEAIKNSDRDGREEGSPLDENEEWAKIATIMSSFGGLMTSIDCSALNHDSVELQLQKIFSEGDSTDKMQSVGDWLDSMELGQYENTLVANGFDDMDFESNNILEEQDLIELGITEADHRKKILESAKCLPPLIPIGTENMPASVESWLQSLHLSQYLENFLNNGYTSMDRVRKVWELELNTVLDITTLGHRKRILASLANRPEEENKENVDKASNITDLNWNLSPLSDRQDSDHSSSGTDINLYRDYTMVKPNYQGQEVVSEVVVNDLVKYDADEQGQIIDKQGKDIRESRICIRPPHLMIDTSPVKQWRHRPEVLIKGCCNYTSQYLGSCLVKQLLGVESTRESIIKMRKSGDTIAKLPNIVLSISYRGVKFIDARSKRVICEHEIGNIFCACQDGEDLTHFAYITKDLETDKHYCHVFSVRSTELATEIILTLGEAFEVAYQVAMKEKSEESAHEFENQLIQKYNDQKPVPASSSGDSSA